MKIIKVILPIFLILAVAYYVYMRTTYFYASGATEVQKVALVARSENNPKLCKKIKIPLLSIPSDSLSSLVEQCYYRLAVLKQDEKICDFISDDATYKSNCILESHNDLSPILCQIGDSATISKCYTGLQQKELDRNSEKI